MNTMEIKDTMNVGKGGKGGNCEGIVPDCNEI